MNALAKARDFLLGGQSSDGAWRDFEIDVGESESWVTAYVGLALLSLSASSVPSPTAASVTRAADWLECAMRPDGSWAYNGFCPSDADTTAHSVCLLEAAGRRAPEECYRWLLASQRTDGGFATFNVPLAGDGWGISHPDVTPVVLEALSTRLAADHPVIKSGIGFALAHVAANSLWQSYWWTTPLYSTYVNTRALDRLGSAYDREKLLHSVLNRVMPQEFFALALLLGTVQRLNRHHELVARLTDALLDAQNADGSWDPAPMLRVTRRCHTEPWVSTGYCGEVYSDVRRLFSTATIARALGETLTA